MILLIIIGVILLIVSFGLKSNAGNPFFKFSGPLRFAGLLVFSLRCSNKLMRAK